MAAKFVAPPIQDNPTGWGPCDVPEQFKDMPYQPFSKGDRLGKVSDWTGATYQDRRYAIKYQSTFGSMQQYAYYHEEDESTFQHVFKTNVPKPLYQRGRYMRNQRNMKNQRNQKGPQMQVLGKGNKRELVRMMKNFSFGFQKKKQQQQHRNRWNRGGHPPIKNRDASVTVRPGWKVIEEMDFPRLSKLSLPNVDDPKDLYLCGSLECYDKGYDRVTVKNEKKLTRINRIFHKVTTTDDPVIRQLTKTENCNVYATDAILSTIMCCTRSSNSWDVVVQKIAGKLFFDKRDDSEFDLLTVSETSSEPPQEEGNSLNSPRNLSLEATFINHNFSQQVLRNDGNRYKFEHENPFLDEDEEDEVAPVGYRYRKWNLGNDISLVARTEHDAFQGGGNDSQFINIKALNEWDSKYSGGVDWRQKLDTQRGAVLANELKNNACKLAKWTVQAILAGSDQIKFGYVSRVNVRDSTKHMILGTQQFKPMEFANQINLNMDNAWGILRCIIDMCMKLPDGKYLIMKDPNKAMIRLYDIPDNTFESDEEENEKQGDGEGDE
ncbi:eukaryotic translation initiation factor 3 subunit D-like isoform X1 [Penaeus japonicus]|uniref:eukaryotic translation initiation factor 3 subunit D-like isoform X1 n=1 Tax=Penaeus japonicus TaxID=27405 RepID=UPI001C70EA98|nr:eukaryotic translation initiation factor 3 subunit D-like isoform X1 [Penaeus japonicus]